MSYSYQTFAYLLIYTTYIMYEATNNCDKNPWDNPFSIRWVVNGLTSLIQIYNNVSVITDIP